MNIFSIQSLSDDKDFVDTFKFTKEQCGIFFK